MSLTGKPQLTQSTTIGNDGFWPDLSLGEFMSHYRIPPEYADQTIRNGITLSMIHVNDILTPVETAINDLGFIEFEAYLDAEPADIADEHPLAVHYRHAVCARAKAFLLQQFNSMNRRENAENAAKEAPDTEQWWLDQSESAIYDLFRIFVPDHQRLRQSGVHVALI